jgi:hypothetical protein
MMLLGLLVGCLIDKDAYERRKDELTDGDGDGFAQEDDCDDADAAVSPDADELCNGYDDNCDGATDEDAVDAPAWYPDADLDGFGAGAATPVLACTPPAGAVSNALDCDDDAIGVNPSAEESPYDGVDDDCSGADLTDVDGDGADAAETGGEDCDDTSADAYPGAAEVPYDGIDQDCDGADAADLDGDGQSGEAAGGVDCDDGDADIYVEAPEDWGNGLVDNDCDGEVEDVRLEFGLEIWRGATAGGQAGRRLGALGDITGDGLAEYLVGAVYEGSLFSGGGAVYLVEGGAPSGDLGTANVLLPGGPSWYLPQVAVGGPDVDGDGTVDVLVSALGYEDFTGATFLVSGAEFAASASLTLPDAAFASVEGDSPGDLGGTGAAFVGDVVGDGGAYLAVSSLYASAGGYSSSGVVAVFDPRDLGSATVSEGLVVVPGPYDDAGIGNIVEAAGDIDEDGLDDYMVSVTYGDIAYVVPGGTTVSLPDDALFRLTGTGAGETCSVKMLGDVDGDGARDLGCIYLDDEVRVFTGLTAGAVRTVAEHSASINLGDGSLSFDLLDLGDLDGDGKSETYVPVMWHPELASSFAAVVFGDELSFRAEIDVADALLSAVSVRPNSLLGYRVARSADVDGDGGEDILVGAYSDDEGGTDAGGALTLPIPR